MKRQSRPIGICRDAAANVRQIANLFYALPAYMVDYHGDSQRITIQRRHKALQGCYNVEDRPEKKLGSLGIAVIKQHM